MDDESAPGPREARANDLYWDSDESVNQIADELDVSKGALYAMVRPLPAGLRCPDCQAGMEYANRTARDRGLLSCPACGLEEDEDAVRDLWEDAAARPEGGEAEGADAEPTGAERRPRHPGPARPPDGERVVVGVALLAAAVGFVLGRLTKRG